MINDFHPTLTEKIQLTHDVWRLVFTLQEGEVLEFSAGQYMILRVGEVRRLYSILSTPAEKGTFELLVEMVPNGIGSSHLANLSVGESTFFQGPAGIFSIKEERPQKIFLATGTGIAPILSMIKTLLGGGWSEDIYLYWGLRAKEDVYFSQEIKELSKTHPNFKPMICLSQESDENLFADPLYRKGRINMYVHGHITKNSEIKNSATFYICGSQPVVESLRTFVAENGIEKANIHFEKFV